MDRTSEQLRSDNKLSHEEFYREWDKLDALREERRALWKIYKDHQMKGYGGLAAVIASLVMVYFNRAPEEIFMAGGLFAIGAYFAINIVSVKDAEREWSSAARKDSEMWGKLTKENPGHYESWKKIHLSRR